MTPCALNSGTLAERATIKTRMDSRGHQVLPTFCVINDPQRFSIDRDKKLDIFGVIRRSLDIFHNELVQDSLTTWERINANLRKAKDREQRVASILEDLPPDIKEQMKDKIFRAMRDDASVAAKMELPLYQIRPSSPLLDDVLCFEPESAKRLKHQGIEDCLKALEAKADITRNDYVRWVEEIG